MSTDQDIGPAAMCFADFIKYANAKNASWRGLVKAGVIDRLCECISGQRMTLKGQILVVPHSPEEPEIVTTLNLILISGLTLNKCHFKATLFLLSPSEHVMGCNEEFLETSFSHRRVSCQ